jgi:hypothetical protein
MRLSATLERLRSWWMRRGVASLVLVAYWAFITLQTEFKLDIPGVSPAQFIQVFWFAGVVLAVVVGLYVARWWLLCAGLTPVVVLGILELQGHRGAWESSGPPLTQYLWWPLLWILSWFFVLPLALGIGVRRGLGERGSWGEARRDRPRRPPQRGPGTPLNS